MEAQAHALYDLEIVGYAESLSEDLLPRAVIPLFRFRQEPERFLVPPFQLEGDTVVGAGTATTAEIATAVAERRFSRLAQPIAARPDHTLWIDSSHLPHYEKVETARRRLMEIAKQSVAASKEALREGRYDAALRLSQRAISADEGCLDAVLTQAIVHRLRGDDARVDLLGEIAAAIDPHIDFRSWVNLYEIRHQYQGTLKEARRKFEKALLLNTLEQNRGNIVRSAKALGIEPRTLKRKASALGIAAG